MGEHLNNIGQNVNSFSGLAPYIPTAIRIIFGVSISAIFIYQGAQVLNVM